MRVFLLVLTIIFHILTLVGAIYVLTSGGTANAGYAVVPMTFSLACLTGYRSYTGKK